MKLSPEAQKLLSEQRNRYFRSLPEKKARISQCWKSIRHNGWSAERLGALKTEAHRLAGSAGSYGLAVLGSAALSLDQVLSGDGDLPSQSPQISGLIAELMHAFDASMD